MKKEQQNNNKCNIYEKKYHICTGMLECYAAASATTAAAALC